MKIKTYLTIAMLSISMLGIAQSKEVTGTVQANKKINYDYEANNFGVEVADGKCWVFEITQTDGGDPRNDTQIKTSLLFEISGKKGAFDHDTEWIKENPVFFQRHCRCLDAGNNRVTEGRISGTELDNGSWKLYIDIKATGKHSGEVYEFKFDGVVE